MSYPNSSDVASGQPTASSHYNNLRKDSVYLGNVAADSVNLSSFLQSFVLNMNIDYLATNRLRIPYDSQAPATIMISGCMLLQTANIDLAASSFSGGAATWYVFANRAAGVTSFTLSVNTSPVPAADQRLIGEVYWDGTNLSQGSIFSYSSSSDALAPDYDSGWFSVTTGTFYAKAHGLGKRPRFVICEHCASASDTAIAVHVVVVGLSAAPYVVGFPLYDSANVGGTTGTSVTAGTLSCSSGGSAAGYHRYKAWY